MYYFHSCWYVYGWCRYRKRGPMLHWLAFSARRITQPGDHLFCHSCTLLSPHHAQSWCAKVEATCDLLGNCDKSFDLLGLINFSGGEGRLPTLGGRYICGIWQGKMLRQIMMMKIVIQSFKKWSWSSTSIFFVDDDWHIQIYYLLCIIILPYHVPNTNIVLSQTHETWWRVLWKYGYVMDMSNLFAVLRINSFVKFLGVMLLHQVWTILIQEKRQDILRSIHTQK